MNLRGLHPNHGGPKAKDVPVAERSGLAPAILGGKLSYKDGVWGDINMVRGELPPDLRNASDDLPAEDPGAVDLVRGAPDVDDPEADPPGSI
jgi:hypothetical protein